MKEYVVLFNKPLVFTEIMTLDIYPPGSYLSVISPKICVVSTNADGIYAEDDDIEVLDGSVGENWKSVFSHLYDAKIQKNGERYKVDIPCKGRRIDDCSLCPKCNQCKMQEDISMIHDVLDGNSTFYDSIGKHNSYVFTFCKKEAA